MPVAKLDLSKQPNPLCSPHGTELVRVPPMKYIMVNGEGQPGGESLQEAMGSSSTSPTRSSGQRTS